MDSRTYLGPDDLDHYLLAAVSEETVISLRQRLHQVSQEYGVPVTSLANAVAAVWDPSYERRKQMGKKLKFGDEARQLKKRLEKLTDPILNEIATDDADAALAVADRAAIARMVERLAQAEREPGAPQRVRENALYETLTVFWRECGHDDARTWSDASKSNYARFLESAAIAVYGPEAGATMRGIMMKAGQAQ